MWVLASMKLVGLAGGLQCKQELGLRVIFYYYFLFFYLLADVSVWVSVCEYGCLPRSEASDLELEL